MLWRERVCCTFWGYSKSGYHTKGVGYLEKIHGCRQIPIRTKMYISKPRSKYKEKKKNISDLISSWGWSNEENPRRIHLYYLNFHWKALLMHILLPLLFSCLCLPHCFVLLYSYRTELWRIEANFDSTDRSGIRLDLSKTLSQIIK